MSYSPDVPIDDPLQDFLNREGFAKTLARALNGWRATESLVVTLFGGWGTGKTSVKNLAIKALRQSAKAPVIIDFNPWLVSGPEQLTASFFHEIGIALGENEADQGEKAQNRLNKWAGYVKAAGKAGELAFGIASVAGLPGAPLIQTALRTAATVSETLQGGAESQKQINEASKKSLTDQKRELRDSFSEEDQKPLLIVIDDIDRLTADEICLLFRLIKANADFPKFIYLLLCDRDVVTTALDKLTPKRGQEFLEKIVQVSFDIPEPSWNDIEACVREEWNNILSLSDDASKLASDDRLRSVLDLARPYLSNIRAARRWLNAFRFSFDFFNQEDGFNANPEDLLAIELLRVFEPQLYHTVCHSKFKLTGGGSDILSYLPEAKDKRIQEKNAFFEAVDKAKLEHAEEIIQWLFPSSSWGFGSNRAQELLGGLRVGHSKCFDRYFQFSVSKETLTRSEIHSALDAAQGYKSFKEFAESFLASDRAFLYLESLEAHAEEFQFGAEDIIQALMDIVDELPNVVWLPNGSGLQYYVFLFIWGILGSVPSSEKRNDIFVNAISKSTGIVLPLMLTHAVCNTTDRHDIIKLDATQVKAVKAVIANKLQAFKDHPLLRQCEFIEFPLYIWKQCGDINDIKDWIHQQISDPKNVLQVLWSATEKEIISNGRHPRSISIKLLLELTTLEEVDAAIRQLPENKLTSNQKELLAIYQKARKSYQEESQTPCNPQTL